MGKWKEVKFEEVFDVLSSKKFQINKSEYQTVGRYPVIDQGKEFIVAFSNIEEKLFKIKNELIIFGDHTREIKYVNFDFIVGADGTKILRLKDKKNNFTKFLYYQLLSKKIKPLGYSRHFKLLKKTIYCLPPLKEQRRIVAKLDALFAAIDRAIGLLEENITHTQALMGSVLDEEFGISKGKTKSLKALVLKTKTLSPKTEYGNDEFTYIDISSINKNIYKIENPKILNGIDAPSRARKIIEKDDVVFATTRPNLKNIAIVSEHFNKPIASTGFCVLRANKELLNNEYLFYFLISDRVQEFIQPFIRGAQYPAISDKDLLSIKIPFISIAEQKNKVKNIKELFFVSNKLVKTQTQKLSNLKSLKSSLLDQAFRREL